MFFIFILVLASMAAPAFAHHKDGHDNGGGGNACQANPDGGGYDCPDGDPGQGDQYDGNNGSGNDPDCEDDNNGRGVPARCRNQTETPQPPVEGTPTATQTQIATEEPTAEPSVVPSVEPSVVPTVVVTLPPVEGTATPVVGETVETDQGTGVIQENSETGELEVVVMATEAPDAQAPRRGPNYEDCFTNDLLAVTDSSRLSRQRGVVFDVDENGRLDRDSMQVVTIENANLTQANTGVNGCHAVGSAVFDDAVLEDMIVFNRAGDLIWHEVTPEVAEVSVTASRSNGLIAFLDATDNGRLHVTDASRSFDWQYDVFADRVEAFGEILFVTIDGYTYQYSFQGELLGEMPEYGSTVANSDEGRYFTGSSLQFERDGEEFFTMGLGDQATDITVWDTETGVVLVDGNLGYSTDIQNDVEFESVLDLQIVDLTSPTYFK